MSDVSSSGGAAPLSPQDKKLYQQDYKHGADLFERVLDEYAKSTNPYQKQEFKELMEKAMQVLNQTASMLKSSSLQKQNQKIEKDWAAYQNQGSPLLADQLRKDLEQAKKIV